jgi:flagellar motility protein MotE (MotC chaperone)
MAYTLLEFLGGEYRPQALGMAEKDETMKITLKQLIVIMACLTLSFPVIYLLMLFATGNARIEFSKPKEKIDERKVKLMAMNARKDSLAEIQSHTFLALEKQKAELDEEKKHASEEQERMLIVKEELEKERASLTEERKKLEKLISQSDELEQKRIKQLGKVYAAMRPEEAAHILESLEDDLLIKILGAMGDDRQKAKVLAALPLEKAARISKKIGNVIK